MAIDSLFAEAPASEIIDEGTEENTESSLEEANSPDNDGQQSEESEESVARSPADSDAEPPLSEEPIVASVGDKPPRADTPTPPTASPQPEQVTVAGASSSSATPRTTRAGAVTAKPSVEAKETAEVVDTPASQEANQDANQGSTAPLPRPSILRRLIQRWVMPHWKLAAASASFLVLGMLLHSLFSPSVSSVKPTEEIKTPAVTTASVHRRSEPISPVVPFDGLDPHVIELGRRLFHESALSGNGKTSCASCHDLSAGGDDGLKTMRGSDGKPGPRNTPTIFNAAFHATQYWDGRADSLEQQLDEHLCDVNIMMSDWTRVIKFLKLDPLYNRSFQLYLGTEPTKEVVKTALATYQRSLVTVDSTFDQWLRGDEQAISSDAIAGYYLFKQLNCVSCHQGSGVGGTMLQSLGGMQEYFAVSKDESSIDVGRFNTTQHTRDRYVFRVPGLRNIQDTAPYFHDGSAATLPEAVEAMMKYQLGLQPQNVEVERLCAFLETLAGKPIPPQAAVETAP